jgi:Tol biopolymer transport system component
LEGERKPTTVLQTPFEESLARFSPDGRWIAYMSNESGGYQVYVQAFPGAPSAPKGKWQVSSHDGGAPVWRGDGKEIYFLTQDGKMMAAGIRATATGIEVETPRELFTTPFYRGTAVPYDVAADGQRFLVEEPTGAADAAPLTVQVHWQAALK